VTGCGVYDSLSRHRFRRDARPGSFTGGGGALLRGPALPIMSANVRGQMNSCPPLLPTSVVGSYAWPSWLACGIAAAQRGEFGPADLAEMLDDAIDTALRDQEEAGVDIVTDGEMRRSGFFTAEFYTHLTGVQAVEPDRRWGPSGHDQQHRFAVSEPIAAPAGLGVVQEFLYARRRTSRPLKITIPGPFTLSGRLIGGDIYRSRLDIAWAFVPIINAELHRLVEAGATFIQIDDPSPAIHPEMAAEFPALFNGAIAGIDVRLGAHLCFGNYAGRPLGKRVYAPVLDQLMRLRVDELVLEFANRELAELPLLREIAAHRDLAIGLIDVKSYYIETPEDVAERIRRVLEFVPIERLTVVPDCGFSQTARWAARAKLRAMVEGTRQVRDELSRG
jgi:5-methyltetrahydropteroyltriglutamate--homocysteine methyltransferase